MGVVDAPEGAGGGRQDQAPAARRAPGPGAWIASLPIYLRDRWALITLVIAVGAFVLRVAGADYGLPYHLYWDEPTIVNRAIRMGSGDLNPHFFYYPGLSFYVTFATEIGLYVVGHLLHVYPSVTAFAAAYFTNSTPFYLVGRVLGALLASVTVVVCYVVGRRFFTPLVGVLAALLLAVSPLHVEYAHFITNDVPLAFFASLTYVWLWDVYTRGRRRDYVLAGVTIGLGIATKYLPGLLLISLALAHVFRVHRQTGRWKMRRAELAPLALGVGAAFLTFCVTSPYNILDWRAAIHDYIVQSQLSSAAGSPNAPLNFGTYLFQQLPWSLGLPVYLVALAGLIGVLRARGERRLQLVLLASYPIIFLLVIGSERQAWDRWLVTLQPFLALSAAAVVVWCARQVPAVLRRLAPRVRMHSVLVTGGMLAGMMLILAVPPAWAATGYDVYLMRPDTRVQAAEWFDTHVPSGTPIAIQLLLDRYYNTAQIMTESQLETIEQEIPASKVSVRQMVDAYFRAHSLYRDVPWVYDLSTLRAEGARYVVLSGWSYHSSNDIAAEDRFYADLQHQAHLVAQFVPPPDAAAYRVAMPTITIYALPSNSTSG
jgi:Dolichyl-phosphate-mannose-protein mannosyltransferase